MSVYTTATLITAKVMGNGGANIATWQYQNLGGAGTFGIARMIMVATPTAARTVVIEQGATATATTAQQIVPTQALTANVPLQINGWITIANNGYLQGYANSTDINAAAYGITSAG